MAKSLPEQISRSFFRYMPISERMREWGFAVTNAGQSVIVPGSDYPPTRHPAHHHFTWESGRVLNSPSFIYVTHGEGLFESASSRPVKVMAGQILVLFPGLWHRYKPDRQTGWHEYWVDFEGQQADHFFGLAGFEPRNPVVTVGLDETLILAFTQLTELARMEPFRMELLLSAEATRILCRITALMDARQLGTHQDAAAISHAKAALLEDSGSDIDLQQMARTAGMSYTSFRRLFKASTGFSPRHFQLEHQLHRAKAMLSHSTLPIGELAEALGFASVYYFSQFFKKKTGLAPLAFRKQAVAQRQTQCFNTNQSPLRS
ncbi:MAG: AraC family transcriptional regulator [bacterium]